jgi:hypothetical protein
MTVNELILELERERDRGNGEKRVVLWMPSEPPYWRDILSLMYRALRPEGRDAVEIV